MTSSKTDAPLWVADSETDPFELGVIPEPFIWGLYNGTTYYEFRETAEFVDFVTKRRMLLYAHNGGKFDWHFLSPWFEPDAELLIINGRLARFKIGRCEFRDSFNLMPVALEQYQKKEFDYTKMHKNFRDQHMDEISEYLESDCVNLYNMVSGFERSYGRHITQASAAMHFWKYRLSNKVPRSSAEFYDIFRPFYYGGRVQCFQHGDFTTDAMSVDINSAYPYAMLAEHPYSLDYKVIEGEPKSDYKKWGPMFFTIECDSKGAFPYRGLNQKLYFPDDGERRIYRITGWELIAALETGTADKIKFLEYYEFAEVQDFSEYVSYFWNLRQDFKKKGDKGGEFYCKIFLNALYGKFGMDIRRHKQYTLKPKSEMSNLISGMMDGQTLQDFKEWIILAEQQAIGKRRFYNLATAASITGFVRSFLWRAINGATDVYYCDTDSITAKGFGPEVQIGKELGQWGIEHEYDRVIVCGKKLYAFHIKGKSFNQKSSWKLASKGARLTYSDLIQIASGEAVQFNNIVPTFSMSKSEPTFVRRVIRGTASDIRKVPRSVDPKYND